MPPELRTLRARLGAHALHAQYDSADLTAAGRKAFLSRFELAVDPNGELRPEERAKRAAHAKKAYFLALAMKSAKARRARK